MFTPNPDRAPVTKHFFSPTVEIILSILIAVLVILFLFILFKNLIQTLFSKTKTVSAVLISKVAEPYVTKKVYASGNAAMSGVGSGVVEKGLDYIFTFQLEDGKMITLIGPKTLYEVALENGKGTLVYKGKKYISFDGPTEGTRVLNEKNNGSITNFVG